MSCTCGARKRALLDYDGDLWRQRPEQPDVWAMELPDGELRTGMDLSEITVQNRFGPCREVWV